MKQQSERLGKDPVSQLLVVLAAPATAGMLLIALHNVINVIYIDRGVGVIGVTAISIAFPVQMMVMAVEETIGIGGGVLISIALGSRDMNKANLVFGNIIGMAILFGIISAVFSLTLLNPLLQFFGASKTVLPFIEEYLGIILYGTIFPAFIFAANNVIRAEGNSKIAMTTLIISSVLNIILTPVFIFFLNMGIRGAAIGTVLAQGITVAYLVYYFASGKSSLSFKSRYLIPKWMLIKQVLTIGLATFIRLASSSIMLIVANNMLLLYGGDSAVAVMGIIVRMIMFTTLPIMGIVQGMLPLVGFNYGSGQLQRVSESIMLAAKAATVIAVLAFLLIMLWPKQLMIIFTSDATVIDMGQSAVRIIFALSFTVGIQMVAGGVFQALGKAKVSFIFSLSRQVLFLIPLLLLLPLLFDLPGIWFAFPIADLLSFLLAVWYIKKHEGIFFKAKLSALTVP